MSPEPLYLAYPILYTCTYLKLPVRIIWRDKIRKTETPKTEPFLQIAFQKGAGACFIF